MQSLRAILAIVVRFKLSRILATVALIALGANTLINAAGAHAQFETGRLRVEFTDQYGEVLTRPVFPSVPVAPGMSPWATTFGVRNAGDITADFKIEHSSRVPADRAPLPRELVITVRDQASDQTMYD